MRENQKTPPPVSRRPFLVAATVYALWLALLVTMAIRQPK